MSSVLCTICARGGSKGVKNKNIKEILGKPLIAYSIEQAKNSGLFEHIIVSTDSEQIMEVAKQYGAEVIFKRPDDLATDSAGKLPVIRHAFCESEKYYKKKFDYLVDLDATAPIRKSEDIINSLQQIQNDNKRNLITAVPARKSPYFNQVELEKGMVKLSKTPEKPILRRQDAPEVFDMNASIYIWTRDSILNDEKIIDSNTSLYVMDEWSMFDVDTEIDYKIVEMLLKELHV